jgi:D-alanyl-D-alanine carboxypeptidase
MRKIFFVFFLTVSLCGASWGPPSLLLVDAVTGEEILSDNASQVRFPASLTKMMTLYIIFEKLRSKDLSLDDSFKISKRAARMPPIKMYLRPGSTIRVRDAICAIALKSANDVSVAAAEHISGSEEAFAERMTQKAQDLGLEDTVFYNASGLPNHRHLSTARDMALLGRCLLRDFPQYYSIFGKPHFVYKGRQYKNTNRLLGKVDGVDGLKTGFTPVAGWNLVASRKIAGQHIIGVVMGETNSARRDVIMTHILDKQVPTVAQIREAEQVLRKRRRGRGPLLYWAIQTGVFKNRKEAQEFATQFKKTNKKSMKIIRRKKFYSTQVGRFDSSKDAKNFCNSIKSKSVKCRVVKTG